VEGASLPLGVGDRLQIGFVARWRLCSAYPCATLLFAEGRNAVQVQRWLGHHSAAFTLATYVHLLDGNLGKPLSLTIGTNDARRQ
jgi:integrase